VPAPTESAPTEPAPTEPASQFEEKLDGIKSALTEAPATSLIDKEAVDAMVDGYAKNLTAGTQYEVLWDRLLPSKIRSMFNLLSGYFCQGYKGLSLAMDQEFTSSYGLGFSDFFRRNFLRVIGRPDLEKEIFARTYAGKINSLGWTHLGLWSSFFTHPASDISFLGTILLVFLIGFLFGLSWKDSLLTENPFAVTSFIGFCTMVFYFSANNQMFQSGEQFIGFSVILFVWLLSRMLFAQKCGKH
jgi:hypothetical protein